MSYLGNVGDVVKIETVDGEISSFEWKIPDFPSLAGEAGDRYASPCFDACDGSWVFQICPKGLWRDSSDFVSLYLYRVDAGPPQTLDITLGIRGPEGVENKKERRHVFSNDDKGCFWYQFCLRWNLRPMLIFKLDMKTGVPSIDRDAITETDDDLKEPLTNGKQFLGKKGVEALQKSLQSLLAGGEDSDCLIKVRGKQFPAHRAILRARSPVFRAMFAHDTLERQSGTVTMEDCDPETFPDFLEHVYTGSVEMVSSTNVFNLYTASDKYDLSTLKEECADFMKRNLTAASFCNTVALAIQHGDQDLVERATDFFCDNSLEIVETAEWQTFLQENAIVGNELFIKTLRHNLKK